ncbi:uncharacterized protein LOC100834379 isoform X2 [Brachypodium distachyon]|uniref:DUF1618 domain-containing protein n=1 Tax=Brachypodium distachyon TaxID=15368 RepID=A0A0Q3K0N3_BRADI|nr:uncharacterized protein LOC100834379 isoform X2 [Brachypodium distachyon]KQK23384.1 hypothetical protein BRADI_1g73060v3 [Brachypodium distachyon]|eukprot:XP_014753413.1 uncharacterized protein LOC100834379 isoform X2 [Brachypodium distachyon]
MYDTASTESIRKIFSSSCRPPPLPCPSAAAPSPAWILLEPLGYVADRTNASTAEASSSTGHTVHVTICVTDPLGVSYVCVHCPGLKESDFSGRPSVVCSEKDFLLLSISFKSAPHAREGLDEYFVYKAGPGRPSLRLLPGPYPHVLTCSDVGLLPRDDGDHFVLATPSFTMDRWVYDLHLFSSMTWTWSTKVAFADISSDVRAKVSTIIRTSKVIQLGGGTLGWVDLWRGILVCNVLDENPVLRYITFPMLMPGHREAAKTSPWSIRSVACSNGLIKLIEIEKHERPDDEKSYDDMDKLYESDCLEKPKVIGWRAIVWYRMTSWDHWRKGCVVYDKEISVDYVRHSMMLPELKDNSAGELTLENLIASYPVLSLTCHSDDVVHMLCESKSDKCESKYCKKKKWMITVDLKKKILVDLAPFTLEGYFSSADPSALSNYLNVAPDPLQKEEWQEVLQEGARRPRMVASEVFNKSQGWMLGNKSCWLQLNNSC